MNISKISFLSNTVTKPFKRFLGGFEISHYPLNTVIQQLFTKLDDEVLVVVLDIGFFAVDYNKNFEILKNALIAFRQNNNSKIIINTVFDEFNDIYMPSKYKQEAKLISLNEQIASLMTEINDLAVLDFYGLCKEHGACNLIDKKNRYLFQVPFTKQALKLISDRIKELILLFKQPRIKVMVLDADNTLWGGIIGEDGLDNIQIDNNYPGIIYREFQQYCLELKQSGIILILLSKNDLQTIDEVFDAKNMPLKLEDFAAVAVNWEPKSENLIKILKKLKLSTSGVIFLDDSDAEIAQMSQRVGIKCYKMHPENPLLNLQTLKDIPNLKTLHVSDEDSNKTKLYRQEEERLNLSEMLQSKDDFIASLKINITVTCNNNAHLQRIAQLINKTNQFNLTTKRYDLAQIKQMMQNDFVYDFKVQDRFGDMGIVGVVIIKNRTIDTFVMSCRVLGREIEQAIISIMAQKHKKLEAVYCKSTKNSLVEEFYDKNKFVLSHRQNGCKYYKLNSLLKINPNIKVIDES